MSDKDDYTPDDYSKEPKSVWRDKSVPIGMLYRGRREELEDDGWTPFAVDNGLMYFRKEVLIYR